MAIVCVYDVESIKKQTRYPIVGLPESKKIIFSIKTGPTKDLLNAKIRIVEFYNVSNGLAVSLFSVAPEISNKNSIQNQKYWFSIFSITIII